MKILSYNICWGCFTNNINDITARPLADLCLKKKHNADNNQCWHNIIRVIMLDNYSLIATQESAFINETINSLKNKNIKINNIELNIDNIKNLRSITYKCPINKELLIPITSFYNEKEFKLLGIKYDDLGKGLSKYSHNLYNDDLGRPMLILLLKHINTNNLLLFINIHNVHFNIKKINKKRLSGKDYIEYRINKLIKTGKWYNPSNNNNYSNNILDKENLSIILAGDFNNHYDNYLGNDIKILNKNINIRDTKNNYHIKKFPNSCCDKRVPVSKLANHNDLIMSSENLKYIKDNQIVNNLLPSKYPASDHLPITAELEFIQ